MALAMREARIKELERSAEAMQTLVARREAADGGELRGIRHELAQSVGAAKRQHAELSELRNALTQLASEESRREVRQWRAAALILAAMLFGVIGLAFWMIYGLTGGFR